MARSLGILIWIAGFLQNSPGWAQDQPAEKKIQCGADLVVLLERPKSPDGRYALGWTMRANDPKSAPVDWSTWDSESPYKFLDHYQYLHPEMTGTGSAFLADAAKSSLVQSLDEGGGAPYELVDGIVDLKSRAFLPLRSLWPYWPHKNHGDISVSWHQGFAIVVNQARFYSQDVWLIRPGKNGLHPTGLSAALNNEVTQVLEEKRPLTWPAYAISWFPDEGREAVFSKSSVRLAFTAEIPKSSYEPVMGSVTIQLESGKILKSESTAKRDNPFLDNPELAKATRDLTDAAKKLHEKLKEPERSAFAEEHRQWMMHRDYGGPFDAGTPLSASVLLYKSDHLSSVPGLDVRSDGEIADFNEHRDASLIKSAQERTADLQKRLKTK